MSQSSAIYFHTVPLTCEIFVSVVKRLIEHGWSVDDGGQISYMVGDYDWENAALSDLEIVLKRICSEIERGIPTGITLVRKDEFVGGSFIFADSEKIMFSLIINCVVIKKSGMTDFSWYLERLLPVFDVVEVLKVTCDHDFL